MPFKKKKDKIKNNEQKQQKKEIISSFELINAWMIPEGEKENDRKTNCLCHSSKTAHSQTNRKEKKTLMLV